MSGYKREDARRRGHEGLQLLERLELIVRPRHDGDMAQATEIEDAIEELRALMEYLIGC